MNIQSVGANSHSVIGNDEDSKASDVGFSKGQIVEGVISRVSDQISINFRGEEVTVSKSTVPDAKEGEIRKYEIMDVSDNSIVLKEVGSNLADQNIRPMECTLVNKQGKSFAKFMDSLQKKFENNSDASHKLNTIKQQMTSEDYADLVKEGNKLEEYQLEQLERALLRIKEQREIKDVGIEKQVENLKNYKEDVEQIAYEMENIFKENNLPLDEEMLKKVEGAMKMAQSAGQLSSTGISYLIENQLSGTIENIYKANFSGVDKNVNIGEEDLRKLEPSIKDVIKKAGYEVTDCTLEDGKWMLSKGLMLTKESFTKLQELKSLKDDVNSEYALNCIIKGIKNGLEPNEAILDNSQENQVVKNINNINQITDSTIKEVIHKYENPTLEQYFGVDESITKDSTYIINEENIKEITAKRQLEEIRLKMTVEAGIRLQDKGFDINTKDLESIVNELREIENEYYKNLLTEQSCQVTNENISRVSNTLAIMSNLRVIPSEVLAKTFPKRSYVNLNELNRTYEAVMTKPRSDMGDSIQKAFQNVDNILKDLGLDLSKENQKAVRILGYNQMEITKENVENMKFYNSKVNRVIDELTPKTVVNLIKNNINPLDLSLDELDRTVKELQQDENLIEDESYSKYLWKLDQNEALTEDERKAYIGIYRLLDKVEKSDGELIGALVNQGKDISLNNLLSSLRTKRDKNMDEKIDESFGLLTEVHSKSESISDQLSYFANLVKDTKEILAPDRLADISTEEAYELSLELLYDVMSETEDGKEMEYYATKMQELKNVFQDSEMAVKYLETYHLPLTMSYIQSAKETMNGKDLSNKLREKNNPELLQSFAGIEESLENVESANKAYEIANDKVQELLLKEVEDNVITYKELATIKAMKGNVDFVTALSKKECYEIPVITGSSITNVKLTLMKGNNEKGTVKIVVSSEKLGKIYAKFRVNQQDVNGFVVCDSRVGEDSLKNTQRIFTDEIKKKSFELKDLNITTDIKVSDKYYYEDTSVGTETSNEQLFNIAKLFIDYMKVAEKQE